MIDGPSPELADAMTLCPGGSIQLDVFEADATYAWNDGPATPSRNVSDEGIYWVDVTRNNCTVRDSIAIAVFDPSALELGPDRLICSGATTALDATMQGATYLWSNGATTPSIIVGAANTYSVTITVSECSAQDAVEVNMLALAPPELGPDVSICEGSSVELSVGVSTASVLWSNGGTGPTIVATAPGTYTATVDSLGCTASDAIVVSVQPMNMEIDLGPERSLCAGAFDLLEAPFIAGATYVWNTGATGPYLSIDGPGTYTVTASGSCIDATASIVVTSEDCGTYVYVPNTFTPNGDGINDTFLPSVAGPVDRFELDIFDRWGERIHTTNDRGAGWDGDYSGVPSQDGVYVWTLTYRVLGPEGVKSERLVGHITLLR